MSVDRDKLIENLRATRNHKLALSDIDMIRSIEGAASFSAFNTDKADWVSYRAALRDLPSTVPETIEDDYSNVPSMPLSPTETAAIPTEE